MIVSPVTLDPRLKKKINVKAKNLYIDILKAMRLRITQHGVSCNECNHQGFNLSINTGNSNIYLLHAIKQYE